MFVLSSKYRHSSQSDAGCNDIEIEHDSFVTVLQWGTGSQQVLGPMGPAPLAQIQPGVAQLERDPLESQANCCLFVSRNALA